MTIRPIAAAALLAAILTFGNTQAAVVGTSTAAVSITPQRIATLPAAARPAWTAYLDRSRRQQAADRAALAAERKPGIPKPPLPHEGSSTRAMPLDRDSAFYATPAARRVADAIVSFQTPARGWSKNMDYRDGPRFPGQPYAPNNLSRFLAAIDFDRPADPAWNYVGTLDNDATTTQIRFLARVQAVTPGTPGDPYRAACLRGVEYLLAAQFPNGGWPPVWPLEGGYHDAITFNDDALTQAATVLSSVAAADPDLAFLPQMLRIRASEAAARALHLILQTQILIAGRRTGWPQQLDALTLQPVAGRNYEPAALSTGESAHLLLYLMDQPNPTPEIASAVASGVAWLQQTALSGYAWTGNRDTPGGRTLVPQPGAVPLWPRYIGLTTGKPIFGDRDRTIHDTVADLSLERRNGYAWYSPAPGDAITRFATWKQTATPGL